MRWISRKAETTSHKTGGVEKGEQQLKRISRSEAESYGSSP
jgi:hypothetical protein